MKTGKTRRQPELTANLGNSFSSMAATSNNKNDLLAGRNRTFCCLLHYSQNSYYISYSYRNFSQRPASLYQRTLKSACNIQVIINRFISIIQDENIL